MSNTFSKTAHQSMSTGAGAASSSNPARKLYSKQNSTVSQRAGGGDTMTSATITSHLMPAVAVNNNG